jgi:hypothetical protein
MARVRLYLYRKAGREVWDAEMWLPDGRRRVWRTGISDRAKAEAAAQARLEEMLALASGAGEGVRTTCVCASDSDESRELPHPPPDEGALSVVQSLATSIARPSVSTRQPETQLAPPATPETTAPGLSERFDRWVFGDLKALFS